MQRKLNQVGSGTLTVSLPSKWSKKNKLKKSDELEVTEIDNKLILSLDRQKQKTIDISLSKEKSDSDTAKFVRSVLGRHYRYGARFRLKIQICWK